MHPVDRKAISFDGRSVTSGFEDEDEYGAKRGTVRRNPKFFYITCVFKLCCDIASCRRDVASVTNKSECGTLV